MFVKGNKKPANSGRKKGTPNKKSIARVADILFDKNINPVEKILSEVRYLTPKEQIDVWLDLLTWCEPKPKAQEVPLEPPVDDSEIKEELKEVSSENIIAFIKNNKGTA